MDTGPVGFQSQIFWGLIFQVQVLKVRLSHVGFKPLFFKEKPRILSSFPIMGFCIRGGVYGKIMSQPLLHVSMSVFSSFTRCGVSQLVFLFLSKELVLYVIVYSRCLREEVSSTLPYWTRTLYWFLIMFFHSKEDGRQELVRGSSKFSNKA